jgi:hypothetical protein
MGFQDEPRQEGQKYFHLRITVKLDKFKVSKGLNRYSKKRIVMANELVSRTLHFANGRFIENGTTANSIHMRFGLKPLAV